MSHREAQGVGEDCLFLFRAGRYTGEDRTESFFVVIPAAEDFKGPFHMLHFVAAVHHGHEHRFIRELTGRAGYVGEAGKQVEAPENAANSLS